MIALAKAKPAELSFSSAGSGGAPHLAGELFKSLTGTDLVHVPYRGSGPAVIEGLLADRRFQFPVERAILGRKAHPRKTAL